MTANPTPDKVDTVAVDLRLDRISRLYNSFDPAPFYEKELEAAADDYIVAEGLLIVGWVAMWGPLDIFLYGWWPIRSRYKLFDRLARIDVEMRSLR